LPATQRFPEPPPASGEPFTSIELALTTVGEPLTVVELALTVGEEPLTVVELALTVVGSQTTIDHRRDPVRGATKKPDRAGQRLWV